eukprot:scaffold1952_cov85-Skeletonema_dohrnii-CCMP3373.AAC.2
MIVAVKEVSKHRRSHRAWRRQLSSPRDRIEECARDMVQRSRGTGLTGQTQTRCSSSSEGEGCTARTRIEREYRRHECRSNGAAAVKDAPIQSSE